MLYLILWAVIAAVIIGADQLTKYLVIQHIPEESSVTVIQGVLRWTHIKNDGAIFGMFDDVPWMFMILSTVGIILMTVMLVGWCKKDPQDKLMQVILTLLISGGIGNMIDRCTLGVVTDFIDFCAFPAIWKWIFNVADCAVTIGGCMMVLWLILSVVKDAKQKKQAVSLPEEQNGDATDDSDTQG